MSGIAKTDQSYYSVSSASEMLKDLLDEKMVAIVKVTKTISTTPYTDNVPGTTSKSESFVACIVQGKTDAQIASMNAEKFLSSSNILTDGVQKIDSTGFNGSVNVSSLLCDAAYQYYNYIFMKKTPLPDSNSQRILSLKTDIPKPEGSDIDPLAVTIKEIMDSSGNIKMSVYNDSSNQVFKQELQFVLKPSSVKSGNSPAPSESILNFNQWDDTDDPEVKHSSYTLRKEETKIEFLPLTWKLSY